MDDKFVEAITGSTEEPPVPIGKKFSTIIEAKFTYTDGGRWHSIDLACGEFLSLLNTGEIDGRPICALEVSQINVEGFPPVLFIYDFVLKNTGRNPWRMN